MPYSLGWHLMIKKGGTDLKSDIGLKEITNIKTNNKTQQHTIPHNKHNTKQSTQQNAK